MEIITRIFEFIFCFFRVYRSSFEFFPIINLLYIYYNKLFLLFFELSYIYIYYYKLHIFEIINIMGEDDEDTCKK